MANLEKEIEKEEKKTEKTLSKLINKKNTWITISAILLVALLIVAFWPGAMGGISKDKAGKLVVTYAQSKGATVTVTNVTSVGSNLYEVLVSYQGQEIPFYVTKDGKYLGQMAPVDTTASNPNPTPQTTTADVSKITITKDTPVLGNANAPVTVYEFSDFSCPYCAMASGDNAQLVAAGKQNFGASWEPIVTNLIKDYVDTGKVKFVVFYSMGHSGGHPAQSVAWCLNDQGLYFKFYPKAYAAYTDVENLSKMQDIAKSIGADMTKLKSCLDSKKYDSRFDTEESLGQSLGLSGTPGFIVDGQIVSGAQPYSVVKGIIDSALAK